MDITPTEQKILLAQAREAITAEIEKREPVYQQADGEIFNKPCGAFVSLHMPNRALRGCIGRMTANMPLIKTVRIMAIEAAFGDPRFPPLQKAELSKCHIEISALSPMESCPDPNMVKVGLHGLYIICGGRTGVLLPQVPVEQGWNREKYLEYICIKAGLPPGHYNAPNAQLFTFTAIVFGEE